LSLSFVILIRCFNTLFFLFKIRAFLSRGEDLLEDKKSVIVYTTYLT